MDGIRVALIATLALLAIGLALSVTALVLATIKLVGA